MSGKRTSSAVVVPAPRMTADQKDPDTLPPKSAGLNIEPGSQDDGWETPPPVTLDDGSTLYLYKDGEGLKAAYDAIGRARFRICLEMYIFRNDATGQAFADALCERARAGVRVYLIYDSLGSLGSGKLIKQMRAAGVRVAEFHPIIPWECRHRYSPWTRDHRKLLVIDDYIGGLGGLNIGDEYAAGWVAGDKAKLVNLMRDQAIGIVGPSARAFVRSFAASWHYVHSGGRIARTLYTHNLKLERLPRKSRIGKQPYRVPDNDTVCGDFGILASAPTLSSPLRPVLSDLLTHASSSITILMAYFAPDDDLIVNLCDAAKRGVRVRLILPGRSDVLAMHAAARSFYARLLENGIEVYERNEAVLHAKTLVVDDRIVMIGSTNLDYRSTEINLEISALVESPAFACQVHALMEHDIRFSTQITAAEWRKQPWRDRFVQWLVSRARYLL